MNEQQRQLVGIVRNHAASSGVVFTPWYGLDLIYKDGMLYKVTPNVPSFHRTYTPVMSLQDIMQSTDQQIWETIMGGYSL
jgi:hypothetical protein